ncbi:MAG: ATP-dependent DNA ligase [Woeseiaceae bacterium]|nr:ATP-dependent DNA ligase [Woeseiaceae bacterium]
MQLSDIVNVSAAVSATRSRLKKRAFLRDGLRAATPDEIPLVVNYLGGVLPQGRIGLGPAIVRQVAAESPAADASLSLAEVDATFDTIATTAGKGSQAAKRNALGRLFSRATAEERDFLIRLVLGELRQGALEGVLVEGIADAADLPAADVRRAVMLAADPAPVALAALTEGADGLTRFRLEPMSPVKPMLAQPTDDIGTAMETLGEAALEYKLDGARIQVHRLGDEVRIFSRRLNEVTNSLPEIVEATLALPARQLILDGEVIALRDDGRPQPFQVTMRRFGRKTDVDAMRGSLPLDAFFFDALHVDGDDLIDRPFRERFVSLAAATDNEMLVRHEVTDSPVAAGRFLAGALEQGHEGIMAKSLDSAYAAGNRGADWLKIKQAHTLDLVILAAEWGSGRRKGWLSNLHLGARNPADGSFVMLGKTFKGLTDKMLDWQTQALLEREIGREEYVVHVRPELVAEIAVNDIQASPQYPAGMALRFARVKRYRDDKTAAEADTIETVRSLFEAQAGASV